MNKIEFGYITWSTNVGFVPLNLCMQKEIFPDNFDRDDRDTVMYQNLSDQTYLPLSGDKLLVDAENEDDYNDDNLQWALYNFFNNDGPRFWHDDSINSS